MDGLWDSRSGAFFGVLTSPWLLSSLSFAGLRWVHSHALRSLSSCLHPWVSGMIDTSRIGLGLEGWEIRIPLALSLLIPSSSER